MNIIQYFTDIKLQNVQLKTKYLYVYILLSSSVVKHPIGLQLLI